MNQCLENLVLSTYRPRRRVRNRRRRDMIIKFDNTIVRVHSNDKRYILRKLRRLGFTINLPIRQIEMACYERVGDRTDPEHTITAY